MPNATARANARTMSKTSPHSDADLIALADRCIAANERLEVAAAAYARVEFASPPNEAAKAEADRTQGAALDELEELILSLARMQPSTFNGLLIKAKALKFAFPEGDVLAKVIEEALKEDPFGPEPMSLVLARDLIVLADQKDYDRVKAGAAAEIKALADDFEAAFQAHLPLFYGAGTDEEAEASTARVDEIARKIVALPTTDIEMMRLKARIYLWSEGTDFKTFAAQNEGDGSSEAVLVSLFRDLGADADPVLAIVAKLRAAWRRLGKVIEETNLCEGPLFDEVQRLLNAAKAELLETPPTTLAGARAAIAWLVEYDEPNIPETSGEYMRTLIRSPIFAREEARAHERRS
jgi:hypothetical protein